MSKHPRAMSANLNELPCSGGRTLHVHTYHLFSFVAYVSYTLCIAMHPRALPIVLFNPHVRI